MLTLYDFEPAPSPRRARIFLAEKEIDYKCVQIDFETQEQLGDAFKAINPRCAVPALLTPDGDVITENLAIASYLEQAYPQNPLMGVTPLERARILEWNWRVEFEGLSAAADILRNTSKRMKDRAITGPHNIAQLPELAERGRQRLGYFYEALNTRLQNSPFVGGETFSLADITAMVLVDFSDWTKSGPSQEHKAIAKWYKVVSSRPSAQA